MRNPARKHSSLGTGSRIKRKVQVTGGSTYIVSLPKEWVKVVGLRHGSEISIEILPDFSLHLKPPHTIESDVAREKEIVITRESLPIAIIDILSAYLAGYGIIRLKHRDVDIEDLVKIVESARSKAIGLEVFEERSNEIILYIIVDTSSLTLREAVEKLTNTTRSMLEDLNIVFKTRDRTIVQSIVERDNVVDKLFLLAMRQLNQILVGKLSPSAQGLDFLPHSLNVLTFIKSVERIADHTVLLARYLTQVRLDDSIEPVFLELFDKTRESYMMAVKGFRKSDRMYASRVLKLVESSRDIEEKIRSLAVKRGLSPVLFLIMDSLRRIRAYSLDIVEATINSIHVREALESRFPGSAQ